MPSQLHEALVLLFRNRPQLAVELLRDALQVPVPAHTRTSLASETMREPRPVAITADAVVLLERARPVLAIIVEVQLHPDDDKLYAWPAYVTLLRRDLHCPVVLLVITPDDSMTRWASGTIACGHPGFTLRPCVIGPEVIPRITDEDIAETDLELAVLSSIAFAREADAVERAEVVLRALARAGVDDERRAVYSDVVIAALPSAARAALEELMSQKYEYQSDIAKRWFKEGRAEGMAAGRAESVLAVLRARGLDVSPDVEARIQNCTDDSLLARWLVRAATAEHTAAVFDDG